MMVRITIPLIGVAIAAAVARPDDASAPAVESQSSRVEPADAGDTQDATEDCTEEQRKRIKLGPVAATRDPAFDALCRSIEAHERDTDRVALEVIKVARASGVASKGEPFGHGDDASQEICISVDAVPPPNLISPPFRVRRFPASAAIAVECEGPVLCLGECATEVAKRVGDKYTAAGQPRVSAGALSFEGPAKVLVTVRVLERVATDAGKARAADPNSVDHNKLPTVNAPTPQPDGGQPGDGGNQ